MGFGTSKDLTPKHPNVNLLNLWGLLRLRTKGATLQKYGDDTSHNRLVTFVKFLLEHSVCENLGLGWHVAYVRWVQVAIGDVSRPRHYDAPWLCNFGLRDISLLINTPPPNCRMSKFRTLSNLHTRVPKNERSGLALDFRTSRKTLLRANTT